MTTEDVIARVTQGLQPVRPLRPVRAALQWLAVTALFFLALVMMRALIGGTGLFGFAPSLWLAQGAAVVTSVTAALAALLGVIPGRSHRVLLWPLLAAAVWLGSLLFDAFQSEPVLAAVGAVFEWPCVLMIGVGSLLPVAGLVRVLRRGAPLTPRSTLAMGALSASGLGNVLSCLSHLHTSGAVLLLWHGVAVLLVVAAGALGGRVVLGWRPTRLS